MGEESKQGKGGKTSKARGKCQSSGATGHEGAHKLGHAGKPHKNIFEYSPYAQNNFFESPSQIDEIAEEDLLESKHLRPKDIQRG